MNICCSFRIHAGLFCRGFVDEIREVALKRGFTVEVTKGSGWLSSYYYFKVTGEDSAVRYFNTEVDRFIARNQ